MRLVDSASQGILEKRSTCSAFTHLILWRTGEDARHSTD